MTTEKAIQLLRRLQDEQFDGIHGDERREALEMAVRALEPNLVKESGDLVQDLVKDCISRQAAIDEIKEIYEWHDNVTKERIIEHFERLPSAHSERKKGRWLVDEDGNMECPFCGNTCGFGNYCNECGADLRGERNEID